MSRQDKHKIAATLRAATHKSKLLSHKSLVLLPTAATLGILTLVSVLFTSADTASNTYAANLGSQITTEVDGQYYVTLTAPDVNFSVSPSKNENAAKQRIDVGVETNVAGGAKLYLSMAGSSNSLHLNGNTAQSSPAIAAVPDNTDASSFPANTWGYSTDDQTYSAVPTTASDPALLANVDGETTGTTSGSVISASIPVYYAANVDTSIPSGSYSNRMTYSAVVDGGITAEATLTSIKVNGVTVQELQKDEINTITVTTNLMVSSFGVPRVIYRTTDPSGYQECGNVLVQKDSEGYMAVTCEVTPTQPATGITLEIIPRGSEGDAFCTDGTYVQGTSDCEEGAWKWGSFTVAVPNLNWRPENFDEIEIMQHMTPEICATASNGETKQLTDERDGKKYWVAKLADGNCWMTQNLELDLKGRTLTSEDSDVSSSWNFDAIGGQWYEDVATSEVDSSLIAGWDFGDYVKSSPTGMEYCINNQSFISNLSSCTRQFTNVSAMEPMTEAINEGKTPDENISIQGNQYDAHYLAGNYYSWAAATAGSGNNTFSYAYAVDSICPAGWRLPLGGSGGQTQGSFYHLLSQYDVAYNWASGNNNITTSPLYFVRSGYTGNANTLSDVGHDGAYWSSRASSSDSAANGLLFYGQVETARNIGRHAGLSIRCVAEWQ